MSIMSEEEKKAIETLKEVASDDFDTLGDDISPKMAQNILNFIKKLQKEIEHELDQRKYWRDNFYKQQKEIEEKNKDIKKLNDLLMLSELDYISKDKIKEKLDKYRKKLEKLHSQELWNEPEDSIKDFKYNHYLEAYKELLEEE